MKEKYEDDFRNIVKSGMQELQNSIRKHFLEEDAEGYEKTGESGDAKQEEKTMRITMLGTSSVGKTAFLSGVYQKLFLHQDEGVALRMNSKYDGEAGYTSIENIAMVRMDGTLKDFPAGTSETKIYGMSLYINAKQCCDFEFMDYRGAYVREIAPGRSPDSTISPEEADKLRKQLEQSDHILLFLDAVQVSKSSDVQVRYNNCRMGMLSLIFSEVLKWKNSHVIVVLTKVDHSSVLPEDKKDNYRILCEKAMEICTQIRSNCRSFAIIPVSAVGEGRTVDYEETKNGETMYGSRMKEAVAPAPINVDGVILYACRAALEKKRLQLKERRDSLREELEQMEPAGRFHAGFFWMQTQGTEWENIGKQLIEIDEKMRKVTREIETINTRRLKSVDENYVYYRKEPEER